MPAEGVPLSPNEMSKDELVRISKIFHSLGVKKVKITGGEPCVRPDIVQIFNELKPLFP